MDAMILDEVKKRVDRESLNPLYQQIESAFENMIGSGLLPAGTRLPGDVITSKHLNVNLRTFQKAMNNLTAKGMLERTKKVGTFVKKSATRQRTPNIGFFYLGVSEYVMSQRAEYIQQFLAEQGYDLKIFPVPYEYHDSANLLEEAEKKDLRGIIIQTVKTPSCFQNLQLLEAARFPYVRLGSRFFIGQLLAPLVCGNTHNQTIDTMEYLWNKGHRKIGIIYCRRDVGILPYREFFQTRGNFPERYALDLTDLSLDLDSSQIPDRIIRGYLEENRDLTAVISEPISTVPNILRQARKMGVEIPEEMSLMCLTDDQVLSMLEKPVTAMRANHREMSRKAVEALMRIIRNGYNEKEEVYQIKYHLQERQTVCQVPALAMA